MFGKLAPVECSLIPVPGASDNLFALFCLRKHTLNIYFIQEALSQYKLKLVTQTK